MRRGGQRRRRARVAAIVGILTVAVVTLAGPAFAIEDVPESYTGPPFGASAPIAPTRYETQDRLWFHDDAWWALLLEPSGDGMRIAELRPDHTWRATGTPIDISPLGGADVQSVDGTLNVVSRRADSSVQFISFTYDAGRRVYVPRTRTPTLVTEIGVTAPPTVARDSTGRLWVAFATSSAVIVVSSADDGRTWSAAQSISASIGPLSGQEVASVVAFDESIGVMWSDQTRSAFRFAVHRDGAPEGEWQFETPVEGPALVDDHISIKVMDREPHDVVVAAVKTSQGDRGENPDSPLILVLSRSTDGTWSSTTGGTVRDGLNSPVIQLDATNDVAYLFADASGTVFAKEAPLDSLIFPPGRGRPFVTSTGSLENANASADPVDARTGLVILSSDLGDRRYRHAEVGIPGTPPPAPEPDTESPDRPADLIARTDEGIVVLAWSPSGDGDRWAPAAEMSPVRGYTVFRNGVEIGTTQSTSFADDPPEGPAYEYAVRAVDFAGNISVPATATIAVTDQGPPAGLAEWTLLGAGVATAVALAARRWALVTR